MSDQSHVSRPLVSVVTPVYNGEQYLREALESLFAQDYEPFESIVVDDGSEDRTPEIARSFPVRYHRQENQGAAAARNTGISLARGELVAWLRVETPTDLDEEQEALLRNLAEMRSEQVGERGLFGRIREAFR